LKNVLSERWFKFSIQIYCESSEFYVRLLQIARNSSQKWGDTLKFAETWQCIDSAGAGTKALLTAYAIY